ncbi:unnamed protein product [Sphagnum tenellum]
MSPDSDDGAGGGGGGPRERERVMGEIATRQQPRHHISRCSRDKRSCRVQTDLPVVDVVAALINADGNAKRTSKKELGPYS